MTEYLYLLFIYTTGMANFRIINKPFLKVRESGGKVEVQNYLTLSIYGKLF